MYGDEDSSLLGMERRLGDKIELVRVEVAGMNGRLTAEQGALEDRITSLEQTNTRNNWKEWIRTAVVIPVIFIIHKIMTAMGIKF